MGRVVVVGSLHYDVMVDAPAWPVQGETLPALGWHPKLGGKGRNQSVAARLAGADVEMVGRIGADAFGQALADDLTRREVGTRWLTRGTSPTGMSVAISDPSGDYRALIASSVNLELGASDLPSAEDLRGAGLVVLQNEIAEATNIAAAMAAAEAGIPVLLNAAPYRPMPPELLKVVGILVLNAVEAGQMAGVPEPASLNAALALARILAARGGGVLVTAGGAGSAYADGRVAITVPARAVTVRSSHGAGDAYVGTLAASLAAGAGIEAAMQLATAAAAEIISALP